ncbi:hypothetical protein RAC89_27695 [Paenibacillus sp. GD4]|uniref:hypothetical protein n=1 Tax=Paenibacillus sp. GD4 TaxID=3068890 RepID=UPI0027968D32|nr:hypothetical protein [Paenibacillus sp. GD4]MDQ1914185.1 hypothetical protein [Paenibacillus sp. GD4]
MLRLLRIRNKRKKRRVYTSKSISKDVLSVALKRGFIGFSLIFLLFACFLTMPVQAAEGDMQMKLPAFSIELNGKPVDNLHLKYPFFIYKDITYMPLTWEVTSTLGVQLHYSEGGLTILRGGGQMGGGWFGWKKEQYPLDLSGSHDANKKYTAAMPGFGLVINDMYMDNGNETYPFLLWNDVTYMPLTWTNAHDYLGLQLRWKGDSTLDIIGGQLQVLERIYYDDAEYLYIYPTFVTEKWQGSLKVKKSMDETPVWMTVEETDALRKRIEEESKHLGGSPVTLTSKDDGLYYEGMKLLPKEQITVDSKEAGNPFIREITGTLYPLGSDRSFLDVTKVTAYNYGNSMTDHYSFLLEKGNAKDVSDTFQNPARIIPNPDGSFWMASNGTSMMRGRIVPGTRKLALVTAQGEIRLANQALGTYDVTVPGVTNPGLHPLDSEGRLLIYAHELNFDPQQSPNRGYYRIDTDLRTTKVEDLDPLAQETPYLPTYTYDWPVYRGIDGKLYLIRKNNDLANYTDNTSMQWYDHQLLR